MKHWQETSRIVERVRALVKSGSGAALATVVKIEGSAYRRPGAKFLIEADGDTVGSVSGGCLEADVREIALDVLRDDTPRLRHYDTGSDEHTVWGLGLGCNGSVDVFIQPLTQERHVVPVQRLGALLAGDDAFVMATMLEGPDAGETMIVTPTESVGSLGAPDVDASVEREARTVRARGAPGMLAEATHAVFIDRFVPPPWLLLCGAGDDARPLAAFASQVGFRVLVADHRPGYLTPERFPEVQRLIQTRADDALNDVPVGPRTYAVIMNHALVHDTAWVRQLIETDVPYIGLLGPRDRTAAILQDVGAAAGDRIYGPVGLDLGADGPEQVALSVVAELLAVVSGRSPRHLRDRSEAIHAG